MKNKRRIGERRRESRIAVIVERDRAYGRELCCGIADAALREDGWALEFVDADSLKRPKVLRGFDGVIARVVDDAMAQRLAASGLPVVDVFCNKRYPLFGSVDGDQAAIGRKAAEHFLARRFTSFAYCGYEGYNYSDERRDAFVALLKGHYHPCSVFRTPRRALAEYDARVTRREDVTLGTDARSLAQWLKGLPSRTAVFCCHDTTGLSGTLHLQERKHCRSGWSRRAGRGQRSACVLVRGSVHFLHRQLRPPRGVGGRGGAFADDALESGAEESPGHPRPAWRRQPTSVNRNIRFYAEVDF